MSKSKLEYLWLDGYEPTQSLRSKTMIEEDFSVERDFIYVEEQEAFFAAVSGTRSPESPAVEALVSMQIIEAAMIAWKEQRRVAIL